jgi:hypothetical protein
VVVGSRGLGSIGSLLLGSVSLRLAAHGPCPTLIVPDSGANVGDRPIVCAVDDSDGSRAATATAATLSDRLGMGLLPSMLCLTMLRPSTATSSSPGSSSSATWARRCEET